MNSADQSGSWARVARFAGYLSAGALLVGTILFLLDATDALGSMNYHPAGRSPLLDEAGYWVAHFAHQRHILWDIITRDTLFPIAYLALMVLSLAVRRAVNADRPATPLMVVFFVVGGTIAIVNDLIFLGATDYWRVTGWSHVDPTRMVAVGRASEAIESLTRWPEAAGFAILAAALVCLGKLCRSERGLPARLGLIAYAEAALLVGVALAGVMQADTPFKIFGVATGAIVGPLVAFWLGRHLGAARGDRAAASVTAAT